MSYLISMNQLEDGVDTLCLQGNGGFVRFYDNK